MPPTSRRLARGAAAALAGLLLTGCSVAGTDLQPGVAAVVGDQTITGDRVDALTVAACDAFEPQLVNENQVVPLGYVRDSLVQNLALASAARQMAATYGVSPGERYQRDVDATRANAGDLPAEQLEAVTTIQTANSLLSDLLGQVGSVIAQRTLPPDVPDDVRNAAPGAASDQAVSIGNDALVDWLSTHEVRIDPKYGIELSPAGVRRVDTAVSFPVSDAAKAGQADQPDQAATMALPATQRCGRFSGDPVG